MQKPLKIIFVVIDILLFFLGVAVFAVGIWVLKGQKLAALQLGITTSYWFHKSAYLIIIFGLVLIFFANIGLSAVIVRSKILLCLFMIFYFIPLLMVVFALGIAWYISSNKDKPSLEEQLRSNWKYKRDEFKQMEISLMCCGINGPTDYRKDVPDSCLDVERSNLSKTNTMLQWLKPDATVMYDNVTMSTYIPNKVTLITTNEINITMTKDLLYNTSQFSTLNFIEFTPANTSYVTVFSSNENNTRPMSMDLYSDIDRKENRSGSVLLRRILQSHSITTSSKNITSNAAGEVFYQTGCLDRIQQMITTMTSVLNGLYVTVLLLMMIAFVVAVILRNQNLVSQSL